MNTPQLVRVRCRFCSKGRDPREFVHDYVIGPCWYCYEKHLEALALLSGNPPKGCQECHRTIAELEALSLADGRADTRLVLERKDGIYQILCPPCDVKYQAKRSDIYRDTPYGAAKGL